MKILIAVVILLMCASSAFAYISEEGRLTDTIKVEVVS